MSFDLESIKKGVVRKAPRIVLLGVEKIGKSTFASGSDSPIFLPIKGEEGVDDLDVAKFERAETFDDVLTAVTTLIKGDHNYKTFIIDSISALEPVIWQHLCKEDKVDQYQFDIQEKMALTLQRWADSIVFANSETMVKTEEIGFNKEKKTGKDLTGARWLFTQKRPGHPGGGRGVYGRLPYKLPLEWSAFNSAASEAAAQ